MRRRHEWLLRSPAFALIFSPSPFYFLDWQLTFQPCSASSKHPLFVGATPTLHPPSQNHVSFEGPGNSTATSCALGLRCPNHAHCHRVRWVRAALCGHNSPWLKSTTFSRKPTADRCFSMVFVQQEPLYRMIICPEPTRRGHSQNCHHCDITDCCVFDIAAMLALFAAIFQ